MQFFSELVIKSLLQIMEMLNDIGWKWYFMINNAYARYVLKTFRH